MRFVHISDTHLGYHQYGLKERAEDFFDVFLEAVEFAISKKVDFVPPYRRFFSFFSPFKPCNPSGDGNSKKT
ncbi:MAG: hypothetical protein Q9M89_02505 [Persephonella sp.]|nr:hypothetical protein [Persephonella sp.]